MKERNCELQVQKTVHEQLLGEIESLKALMTTTASERDEAAAALAAGREALISSRASLAERDNALTKVLQRLSHAERELSDRSAAVEELQS
jgi:DNA-binding NarL/FixJ family response regulator